MLVGMHCDNRRPHFHAGARSTPETRLHHATSIPSREPGTSNLQLRIVVGQALELEFVPSEVPVPIGHGLASIQENHDIGGRVRNVLRWPLLIADAFVPIEPYHEQPVSAWRIVST